MNEERRKLFLQWVMPVVILMLLIIVLFFNFYIRMRRAEVTQFETDILRITTGYAEDIHNDIEIMLKAGETIAGITANTSGSEDVWIQAAVNSLVNNTPAYEVMYYDGDRFCVTHEGKKTMLSEYTYAAAVIRAADVKYIYLKDDEITEQGAVLVVIPMGESTGQKLMMYYPMDRISSFLSMSSEFDTQTFTALMNLDGNILLRGEKGSNFLANGNVWYNLDQEKYEDDIARAKAQITNRTSGFMAAEVKQEERILVYVPIQINEWFFMAGIRQEYAERTQTRYWRQTSIMLYELLAVVVVFLIVFIVINLSARKKTEEKGKLLQEKADTDLLTGLTNKLATERKIKEYMRDYPDKLAMLFVLDIDNFKKINDTMGHAFGDEVLRSLGSQIGAVFRLTDIIGRTGGDEFMIFLKFLKTDEDTLKEAQKLVSFFQGFVAGEYVKYSATASIGAAVFPAHGADFETLYKSADKALYKAKKRGKNQLAFYDDRDRPGQEEEDIPDDVLQSSRENDR